MLIYRAIAQHDRYLPVRTKRDFAVLDKERVARSNFEDVSENAATAQRRPERENLIERLEIELPFYARVLEQRLDFGSEQQRPVRDGVEERPDAKAISGEQQALARGVPRRTPIRRSESARTRHRIHDKDEG